MRQAINNEWKTKGSLNNLKDVHMLYCPDSKQISKDERNIFIKGNIKDVTDNFQVTNTMIKSRIKLLLIIQYIPQSLMVYCANDVRATFNVFTKLFENFFER